MNEKRSEMWNRIGLALLQQGTYQFPSLITRTVRKKNEFVIRNTKDILTASSCSRCCHFLFEPSHQIICLNFS